MIDAAERDLMKETVRAALAAADPSDAIDDVLAKLGWLELLASEPGDAIEIVFGALGATNRASTALDDVMLAALGIEPRADLAVLLPYGFSTPPGERGDEGIGAGLATARAGVARELLVVGGSASEPWIAVVPMQAAERRCAIRGIDPDGGWHDVVVRTSAGDRQRLEPSAWEEAVALGRRAVAHQIAGASRTMLELARTHALERVQFGRPIARFQAVRHKLAESLVAVEALDACLVAARDDLGADTAALAKAVAGRTARTVATHCQQVLAGIGFTSEHAFHRFLKRSMALERLFGTSDEIALDLGRKLIAARRVPTLIEL